MTTIQINLTGDESPTVRRAALNALVAFNAAMHGEIGNDAPDVGRPGVDPLPLVMMPAPSAAAAAALPTAQEAFGATSLPLPPVATFPVPLPAPPAAVPSAGPTASAPAGEVDSAGVPWNAEIHAGNKSKKKDGTWRGKRGAGQPEETDEPAAAALPAPPIAVLPPPPAAAIPQPPAATGAGVPTNFPEFMTAAMPLVRDQKLAGDRFTAILKKHGLAGPSDLGKQPHLIAAVWGDIQLAVAGF